MLKSEKGTKGSLQITQKMLVPCTAATKDDKQRVQRIIKMGTDSIRLKRIKWTQLKVFPRKGNRRREEVFPGPSPLTQWRNQLDK